MNKKVFATVASATAAIAAVGLITTGTATATTPIGPVNNSCDTVLGVKPPVVRNDGIFIADPEPTLVATSVLIRSIGTGSLSGDIPGKVVMGGILVPTQGIGIGTLSGTYLRGPTYLPCTVNGTFMLT